ncbi:hypothetical protein [Ponticaulis sp.]|uniref:hypothetical protein n=1 Tax=Ponticaulis sp. TaxID=2020902 RepID=UPI000B725335|nr:hypothetical protein [Ponticaulis sp.]MAJ07950.1 hypothetical protein [Ponticaulis sp.]RPG18260.1 MAG: hypothetical protein CBC85_003250 [Hyphomonadaceae bacterium TMED125]HBH90810.1 hypothetical protein [Hyphomonadaceae bacterium]HBJ92795.1 hypothetical protein [Hyphomonadaceae bacterium]
MKAIKTALIAASAFGLAGAAHADEVWSSDEGNIVFLSELETGEAIIGAPVGNTMIRMIFPGLAGNYDNRSMHDGVWISSSSFGTEPCSISVQDPETGETSAYWGRAQMIFTSTGYPSDIVLTAGVCFGDPEEMLFGEALNQ